MWKKRWPIRKEEKYKNTRKQRQYFYITSIYLLFRKASVRSNKSCIKVDFIKKNIKEEVNI